ncbi:putative transcriptional regulator of viral defense system [Bacilli bacterium PM5-3]|nr:putative transcriptional regulator of viral defense system [Bacilli bacterium PM5-3]
MKYKYNNMYNDYSIIDFLVRILYNFYEQKSMEVNILNKNDVLIDYLENNNGMIKAAVANKINISNKQLQKFVNENKLERVAFGLYNASNQFPDEYYIAQYRCPKGIYSYETALYFNGLSDRIPQKLKMTIPNNHNSKLLTDDKYKFYYCKKEIHELGVITVQSPYGNDIKVYNKERTICDCIKKQSSLDEDLVLLAIKRYLKESENDYAKLLEIAEILKVDEKIKQYIKLLI